MSGRHELDAAWLFDVEGVPSSAEIAEQRDRLRPGFRAMFEAAAACRDDEVRERALVVRRKMKALVNLIDERIESRLIIQSVLDDGLPSHKLGSLRDRIKRAWRSAFQNAKHGPLEVQDERDVEIDLPDRVLEHAVLALESDQAVIDFILHGELPLSCPEASGARETAHRLSETAK